MNPFLEDDLDVFFEGLDARDVTAFLFDGSTHSFRGYLDAPSSQHGLGDGFELGTAGFRLTCKSSDAAAIVKDETVISVAGTDYDVEGLQHDGTGICVLDLSEAAVIVEEAY